MPQEIIAIDYEATGFNAYNGDEIFAFCITNKDIETTVYRFDWKCKEVNEESHRIFRKYHRPKYIKIAHNAKFEQGFTAMYFGGELPTSEWRDTLIMSQMLRNLLMSHKLEVLAKRYFSEMYPTEYGYWEYYDKQVKLHMTKQKKLMNNNPERVEEEIYYPLTKEGVKPLVLDRPNYGLIPLNIMNGYQVADGDRCMLLHELMWPKIVEDDLLHTDFLNEMQLIKASQKMEQTGMMIHTRNTEKLIKELGAKLAVLTKKKKQIFGFDINLDSSDQVQKHLLGYVDIKKHEKMDTEWKKIKPRFNMVTPVLTPKGAPSASKISILELQERYPTNQALDILLQWRAFAKGHSTIKGYLELIDKEYVLHPNINTNKAATGRESISNPALQNVSKEFSAKTVYGIPARRCFRPRPGYVYFLGDYAGIEMRMIINASGEQILIDKLHEDIDYDVHSFNAEVMLENEWLDITDKKERKLVRAGIKDVGFAIPYGAGISKLCTAFKKPRNEVKSILKRYAEVCPNISSFNRTQMAKVRSKGYITTVFGRKLSIFSDKAYTAANYQIQGDAAGTFKRGQNNIAAYLDKVWNNEIRMLLPVHDEIIIEYPRYLLNDYLAVLHDLNWCMINIPEIKTPLMTEWKIAKTCWQDAEEIQI